MAERTEEKEIKKKYNIIDTIEKRDLMKIATALGE